MAEENIVKAIQRVKTPNGEYVTVFPMTSTDFIIHDIAKQKTLDEYLTELDKKASDSIRTIDDIIYDEENNISLHEHLVSEFDNIKNGTSITSLDAGSIKSGTISIERLPHGALERCIVVDTDAARYSLTKENAQVGDTVKVNNSGMLYFIVDDTKLNTDEGYEQYNAGTALSAVNVHWVGVLNTPTTLEGYGITDAAKASDIELIKKDLGDIKDSITEDAVPKKHVVRTEYGDITTFRDPYSYMGSNEVLENGSMVLKTPFIPSQDGASLSIDLSIARNNTIDLTLANKFKIDKLAATAPSGENRVITSAASKLGTHLAITAASGNTIETKIYSIYQDTLSSIEYNSDVNFDLCEFSEDGMVFVGLVKSTSTIMVFYKSTTGYVLQNSFTLSTSDVKDLHIVDPERTTNTSTDRQLLLIIIYNNAPAGIYKINSSSATLDNNIFNLGTLVATNVDSSEDGKIVVFSTKATTVGDNLRLYGYSNGVFSVYATRNTISANPINKVKLSPDGTRMGVLFNVYPTILYEYDILSTTVTSRVNRQTSKSIYDLIYTRDNNIIFTVSDSTNRILVMDGSNKESTSLVGSSILSTMMNANPSKILLSSYHGYGFIIKSISTSDNTYPQIIPITISMGIEQSLGGVPISMIPNKAVEVSNNGKYIIAAPLANSAIRIYRKSGNEYINAILTSPTTLSNTVDVAISGDGMIAAAITQTSCYVYSNNGSGTFTQSVLTQLTDNSTHFTSVAIAVKDSIPYILLSTNGANNKYALAYNLNSISAPVELSVGGITSVGKFTTSNDRIVWVSDDGELHEYFINENSISHAKIIATGCSGMIKLSQDSNNGVFKLTTGELRLLYTSKMGTYSFDTYDKISADYACISPDNRYLYAIRGNTIDCYSILSNVKEDTKLLLVDSYTNTNIRYANDLFITDDQLIILSNVYPYTQVLNINEVEGGANITLDADISLADAPILSNFKTSFDNLELLSGVGIAYILDESNRISLVITSKNKQQTNTKLHINKVSFYGDLDSHIYANNAYYDYDVSYIDFENGSEDWSDVQYVDNSLKYKNLNINGTATINGEKVVTLTKVPNVTIVSPRWKPEYVSSGYIYKCRINNSKITADSIVNIDINDIKSIDIANEANMYGNTVEGDGFVDIFAESIPTGSIVVTLNIYK